MRRGWIAVAAAAHVARGRAGGFMQVGHGKAAPLRRLAGGDVVAYYAPTTEFGGKDKLQAFVGICILSAAAPYEADMGESFRPFRRDVAWLEARPAPIASLLGLLDFTAGARNWGYRLGTGLFPVSPHDIAAIAAAMKAELPNSVDST